MSRVQRVIAILGVGFWVSAVAVSQPQAPAAAPAVDGPRTGEASAGDVSGSLLAGSVDPRQFGTQDRTITVLSGLQFNGTCYGIDAATLSLRICSSSHYFTTLDLPAGAVIDFIGVNTATTADGALGFTLYVRNESSATPLASFSIPGHGGFATDYAGPLNILVPAKKDRTYVLAVDTAPGLVDLQYFGYVEIWWRRAVSDPPATPTFGDVPGSHPFYQFIEALASSGITGGCGGGNFCPDNPLTRGQMAVFLSKALGLHWPY
jgi:S-layer homology domain